MTKIALIGRPNVGKSSLFNRIIRKREAITSDVSGTTRDVRRHLALIEGKEAMLLDTGGLDESNELFKRVREKSLTAANEADIILFMVDGKMAPDELDKKIFYDLQRLGKDIALVINKVDNQKEKERAAEFRVFGAKTVFYLSVSHNLEVDELLEWVAKKIDSDVPLSADEDESFEDFLEEYDEDNFNQDNENGKNGGKNGGEDEDGNKDMQGDGQEDVDFENMTELEIAEEPSEIRVAIIGRVNVGKSSLLNALTGEERSVVSEVAGTTIDPVDETIEYEGRQITFVDTAGIRRRGKIEGIEKFALDRTEKMLENAHVVLLVLDASEEFVDLDEKIAGLIDKHALASIIVLNKWDAALDDFKKASKKVKDRFRFLAHSPIISISALSKKRVHKLNDLIVKIYENFSRRVPTSRLNEEVKAATLKHKIPSDKGKLIKIYFATQYGVRPPKIALVMNRPILHFSYKRYLANSLREKFDFEGSPILFKVKRRGEKDIEESEEE